MKATCASCGLSFVTAPSLWQARITVNGREISLGYFKTIEEAATAYTQGAKRFFGEYARTE